MKKTRISKKEAKNKYGVLTKKNDGLIYFLLENGNVIDSIGDTRYIKNTERTYRESVKKTIDLNTLATILWRSNFMEDKNKIRRQAKKDIVRLITYGIIGELQLNKQEQKMFINLI